MVGAAPIDRYVVLEHLSEGGMGAIYVGKKLGAGGFEMEVVLKQLLPEFTQQEEFIDLFLREAKLSATLDHANIVHTIDLVTAGGEYFIVMEYLPGGDLRTLLKRAKRRGKRFTPAAAIRITREVLSALAYAHVKRDFDGKPLKLIHRDVSPSNILVSYAGEVKLTDFGIAKAATHNSLFYKVKGKIGYMSPEQAKSEPLDHRSDLYSLAVCLYETITGERLFVHAGITTSAEEIYSQKVPRVSRKVPGLPAELDAIMEKALAIDPARRYQTAGELNEALTRCAHRNQLLMSAPELADELLVACGDTAQWRNDEDDEDEVDSARRPGTEVYDIGDDDDDESLAPMSIHSLAAKANKVRKPSQPAHPERPKTEIEKFQGVELTSIINMIDLEGADGAKPLVDLLDSGPRLVDSGPRPLAGLESGPRAMPVAPKTTSLRPATANRPHQPPIDEGLPTAPRRFDPRGPAHPPMQQTMQGLPPMAAIQQQRAQQPSNPAGGYPQPYSQGPPGPYPDPRLAPRDPRSSTARGKRSSVRTWVVILLILVAAGFATFFIATSGPDVAVQGK